MSEAIKIDIWSDLVCPWCYIGKRRLEAGLEDFAGRPEAAPVTIEWHSYELNPDTPAEVEGSEIDYLVRHKGIAEAQARKMLAQVSDIARSVGLAYDFDRVRPANTVKAHELMHYAKARGLQGEAKERLFRAHFVEGRNLGSDEELAGLAAEIGLEASDVLRSLIEGEHRGAVRADEEQARSYGITGVPFFVIDGRYGISGAQPPSTFAAALSQVAAERGESATGGGISPAGS